jgi:hypothetical protein
MLYSLNKQCGGNFEKYAEVDDGTWPVIFDEFAEFFEKNK